MVDSLKEQNSVALTNNDKNELSQIQGFLQSFLDTAALTINLNMQVIDRDRLCIAAAGSPTIRSRIGLYSRPDGIIARLYLNGAKRIYVRHPGFEEACRGCGDFQKGDRGCLYRCGAMAAIRLEEKTIGAIAITGETDEALERINQQEDQIYAFTEALAVLIGDKLMENRRIQQVNTYAKFLQTAISAISHGVILINSDGVILAQNDSFTKKLGLVPDELNGKKIQTIFPNLTVDLLEKMRGNGELYELHHHGSVFLVEVLSTSQSDTSTGFVLTLDDLKDTYHRAYRLADQPKDLIFGDILGKDPDFLSFKTKVHSVAGYDSTILLTGETGSGKELFARAIHAASRRKNEPFVIVNCGSIPDTLIESELFGYEKGAFTGANPAGRHGKFYLADKGTLFLDELENTPLYMQQKLLRVLETGEVERLGGKNTIHVDVRIIAASNRNLDEMVKEGTFRQDLYHRLSVIPFRIPPLRERGEDILLLTEHFIDIFNTKYDKNIKRLSDEVRKLFMQYRWPGNIRELQNAIEFAVSMCIGTVITMDHLPYFLRIETNRPPIRKLHDIELEYIKKAVNQFGWTDEGKTKAAKSLGISRATIYRKLKEIEGNHV